MRYTIHSFNLVKTCTVDARCIFTRNLLLAKWSTQNCLPNSYKSIMVGVSCSVDTSTAMVSYIELVPYHEEACDVNMIHCCLLFQRKDSYSSSSERDIARFYEIKCTFVYPFNRSRCGIRSCRCLKWFVHTDEFNSSDHYSKKYQTHHL